MIYLKTLQAAVDGIVYDSRKAAADTVFVCLRGIDTDGHKYAQAAYDRGCRLFAAEEKLPLPDDAKQVLFPDTRAALRELADEYYGRPQDLLTLIGVTGTKGKTSTTAYLSAILNAAGHKTGIIGTTGIRYGTNTEPTVNSTPESIELRRAFRQMVDAGCTHCVMEVSSQAMKTGRVSGLHYQVGIFTNLSPDHIGPREHSSYEEYRVCKADLFSICDKAVLNADDDAFPFMAEHASEIITYGQNQEADARIDSIRTDRIGSRIETSFQLNGFPMSVPTPGLFSAYNAAAAAAAAAALGIDQSIASEALKNAAVPGRFEIVDTLPGVVCVIDYAHNEVSLRSALTALRNCSPKRLICLFGCIGGRAEMRRRPMGAAAAELADFSIVTSDNPDFEEPEKILRDVESGMGNAPHLCIADRAEAIRTAVEMAREGDILLLAGKGHEDYQIVEGKHVPFSERSILETLSRK